jgi:hypothetical protein
MTVFTKTDRWLARIWPFLVMRKVDAIVDENNRVDEDATWAARLITPAAQQAALRIGDQEVSRIERLEDKLDRQQPVAALLIPVATALLAAAWLRGYPIIVITTFIALVAAGFGLLTAARANVPFTHRTLTVPELEEMLASEDGLGAAVAARAITDSQRNIPYGTGIQNRVGAVRHAIFSSLSFIVLSAVLFAVPNWGAVGSDASDRKLDRSTRGVQALAMDLSIVRERLKANGAMDRRTQRDLRELRQDVRRVRHRTTRSRR